MLNWWNSLTRSEKIALVGVLVSAFGIFVSFLIANGDTVTQNTSGNNSPALNNINGDVTINGSEPK